MKDENTTTTSNDSVVDRSETKDQPATTQPDCTASVSSSDSMECQPSSSRYADSESVSNSSSMECQASTTQSPGTASISSSGFQDSTLEHGPPPTLEEVRAAIPEEGIPLGELVKLFKARVFGKERTVAFISLVQQSGRLDFVTKLVILRKQ